MLGQIVGIGRTLQFQPSGGVSPVLTDNDYRLLLRATIGNNHWDGTQQGLWNNWKLLFPNGSISIVDNQDMTVSAIIIGTYSSIVQDMIAGYATNGVLNGSIINSLIVPMSEGVGYNYALGGSPFFSFDHLDSSLSGFDTGVWSST
jgi:hypothetical protein